MTNTTRSDLAYRKLANNLIDQQEPADDRIDKITDKVIQYMDATDPSEWSKEQWQLFKQIWQEQKNKRTPHTSIKTSEMTTAELLRRMNSGATSSS